MAERLCPRYSDDGGSGALVLHVLPFTLTQMPGLATAGNVNVSLHFEASLRGGATVIELDAYKGTRKGALSASQHAVPHCQFRVPPVLDSCLFLTRTCAVSPTCSVIPTCSVNGV
eukprot:1138769-Pelagomonas_calceolata.AAC.2